MTLGEKIQDLRRRNAISQDVLAEKLAVSRQAVSKWERDEAVPETDKIIRLAQVFGVTTDYLLLNDDPQPQPQAPYQAPPRQTSGFGGRAEHFIRRHGYKGGYVMTAIGGLLCVIALLVFTLLPRFGSGMFDSAGSIGNDWNSGIIIEGELPQDVLDAIYGQAGSGMGGSIFDSFESEYQQSVNQMHSAWQSSVSIMAAMFGIPVLLVGGSLVALGLYIVIKGKKIAAEAA